MKILFFFISVNIKCLDFSPVDFCQGFLIEPLALAFNLPVRFQFSDSSIGRCVTLVTAAAAETVVDTLAESTEQAADTGAHQEDGNPSQHEPHPDVGSALTVQP